ncbi:nostrin isoform X3 [Balaenoptera ricei]|uniref:nostrin isoform X3 n=1 Tax=Balaenoptera ricei TaxID=2746895 RepID=UPI0028BD6FDC|nr:nostrin isoform X3 [Balaenoptera ricei]XP_059784018.1 nostrin isoform X3 [Balaenoptera ricei]XP_059784019.1 nostrin isoform X3 [Balaenoptera ricei]XP_059784020.1 nostrin isoform X3 [Balaenoptera ricei]
MFVEIKMRKLGCPIVILLSCLRGESFLHDGGYTWIALQYNKVYKNLKEFSQNGEDFCKQITSILQQRANLEISYAKGLQKLATKLSKTLQSTKKNCLVSAWAWVSEGMKSAADLHQKLGKAIELEAVKPTHQVLSAHEKKRKSLDNEVEKTANLVISNWNHQIKAKKKLMVSTKKHEALFHLVESSKQITTEKEKQKLLNKLKKSTEKLSKEDENYYQKNMASCSARLKWENTLENCFQSNLELEKERIQLLCNNLNQYSQHISVFGQTLTTCHTQIHCAISKIDVENDIQALVEETAVLSTENKSEFLLTDYFEEDPKNAMSKERQASSIKSKLLRLQKDIEKASRDQEGLERMLKAYSSHSSFSDTESQKSTAALMDENNLKLNLLQANAYKLSSVLAELEQRPQPNHVCSNSIFKWKEKQQTHSSVKISRPFLTKRLENVVSRSSSGGQRIPSSSSTASGVTQLGNGLCKALYSFQARQDDELNLEKGDIVTIHKKKDEGWWFGSLKGKKGHFPAAYVEELPSTAGATSSQA